jgi:hypothetical protein
MDMASSTSRVWQPFGPPTLQHWESLVAFMASRLRWWAILDALIKQFLGQRMGPKRGFQAILKLMPGPGNAEVASEPECQGPVT